MSHNDSDELACDFGHEEALLELDPVTQAGHAGSRQHVQLLAGNGPSWRAETTSLLQVRLRSVAAIVVLVSSGTLLWTLINQSQDPTGGLAVVRIGALARLLLVGGLLIWLYAKPDFKLPALRCFEYAIFGFLALTWIYVRYGRIVIDASTDPTHLLVSGRESLLALFAWMVLHGILMPHRWHETAKVVLSMGLAPLVVLVLVQILRPDLQGQLDEITSLHNLSFHVLVVCIAASLSIYASHVLNAFRQEAYAGKQFGQYHLLSKLGEGGMGEVYRAEHALLKRPCALKLIRSDSVQDPLALRRFEREVKVTSSLTHPNTISIFDYGHTDDGVFYYVMELLPGIPLSELIAQGPVAPGRAIYLLRQVCSALAEAHQAGLIHRDLKPANIFVSERGGLCDFVKILDFGIVKLVHSTPGEPMTMEQTVSGTPLYMSPEQAVAPEGIDARSDLYALGAVAYHMLTGRPPFVDANPMKVLIDHAGGVVVPPSELNAELPRDLEHVVLRCLAKSPDDRFPSALDLERALDACAAASEWDATQAAIWWYDRLATPLGTPTDDRLAPLEAPAESD